jgi:hypothetical protein
MKKFFLDAMSLRKVYPWSMTCQDAIQWHRIETGQVIDLPLPLPPFPEEPVPTKMAVLCEVRTLFAKRCGYGHGQPTPAAARGRGATRGNRGHRGGRGSGV